MKQQRGFTLLETVITLSIFGMFIFILVLLTAEMRGNEKRYPVNLMKHPQVAATLARLRKDVYDAFGANPYPASYQNHTQGPDKLLIYSIQQSGFAETVVWDFSQPGLARRSAFRVGNLSTEWVARGLPANIVIGTYEIPGRPWAVRVTAHDGQGRLAIDQIYQPRAHQ